MKILVFILGVFMSVAAVAKQPVESGNAISQPATPAKSSREPSVEDVQKIEAYLNGITTMTAPFVQEDDQGKQARGTFYLSRPGRLRWDYAPPTPILIVAKGSLVAYYDKELDELSHTSVDDTLAGFLTKPRISFGDGGIKIIYFEKTNGEMKITVSQEKKEEQGNLTLVFKLANMDLARMEVIDSIGKKTTIWFEGLVYNTTLDKDLFVFPRVKTKRKN